MNNLTVYFPDLGMEEARVVSILVAAGSVIKTGQPILVLESDKVQLDFPSEHDGILVRWCVELGGSIRKGDALFECQEEGQDVPVSTPAPARRFEQRSAETMVHAGPGARMLAQAHGIDWREIPGTGLRGRVRYEDVRAWMDRPLPLEKRQETPSSLTLTPIQRAAAQQLRRAWQEVVHVTHGAHADITVLEDWRLAQREKISLMPLLIRAVAKALIAYPALGMRLSADGGQLDPAPEGINVVVDTPQGLVLPLMQKVPSSSVWELRDQLSSLAHRARAQQLAREDLAVGQISISSLGGIGGEWFTPIVYAPQVAIVGVMKAQWQPIWQAHAWIPRYRLPLVVSYDHRALDGALVQRFLNAICEALEHMAETL